MSRTAQAIINLAALKHNLGIVKQHAPQSQVMAVIKADAYGHGMLEVATALVDADAFAVACLSEARILREAGINKKILCLEGMTSADELEAFAQQQIDMVVHHEWQLQVLAESQHQAALNVWLKHDSGMHRLGFNDEQLQRGLALCKSCSAINRVSLFTHMANADNKNDTSTTQQIERFNAATESFVGEKSLSNSACILGWPDAHADWVRPGIMLYGVNPFITGSAAECDLKPVMTFKSQLISIRQQKQGDPIGYGGEWTCPNDMTLGVVAVGYGDGYPRHAKPGTKVLIGGKKYPLVGRVSMDLLTIDLSGAVDTAVGDAVTLWGEGLPVEQIAADAKTIAYELLCGVSQRVAHVYVD
ncbi:MAG: alanine racemase [Gammaproteobacteria bacterium]|nr:alanine racemase [Gammaproteobacteria bacterium]